MQGPRRQPRIFRGEIVHSGAISASTALREFIQGRCRSGAMMRGPGSHPARRGAGAGATARRTGLFSKGDPGLILIISYVHHHCNQAYALPLRTKEPKLIPKFDRRHLQRTVVAREMTAVELGA